MQGRSKVEGNEAVSAFILALKDYEFLYIEEITHDGNSFDFSTMCFYLYYN